MEANHLEDSKSSSEETDKSDHQSNSDMGSRRSYECVFCKRGFTTAQALGGHMNIHRKDRAKSRRSSVPILSGNKVDDGENNASLRSYSYPPFQSYHQPHYSIAPEIHHHYHVSYQAFLPASGWGFRLPHTQKNSELFVDNSQHLNPFGEEEDWSRSLRLRIGPSHVDDNENKKTVGSSREDELDLELRLGHDP